MSECSLINTPSSSRWPASSAARRRQRLVGSEPRAAAAAEDERARVSRAIHASLDAGGEELLQRGRAAHQIERQLRVPRGVPVADGEPHILAHPFGPQRGGGEAG